MSEGISVDIIPQFWTVILTLFNTLVLFLILRHFLFNAVHNMIENRRQSIKSEFEKAETLQLAGQELINQYDGKLKTINEEKSEIIQGARKRGDEILAKLKEEGEKERERILKAAESEKNLMFDKAKEQLRLETVDLSIGIAEQIIKRELDQQTSRKMVDSIIKDLSGLKM